MSFCSGVTWACFLVTATACSNLSAGGGYDTAWHGILGDSWAPHYLPACILDRGLLPYETDMVPYFAQFPVIMVTAETVQQWGRLVYRSDLARYGDQWTRQTWWNYRRIAEALAKGEILPGSDLTATRAREKKSVHYRQGLPPVLVVNPFAAHDKSGAPGRGQVAVSAELGDHSRVALRSGSSGPQPQRIINPFVAEH